MKIPLMWKAFRALQKVPVYSVKLVTSLDSLPAFVIRKSKLHSSPGNQRHINYKLGQYMQKKVPYVVNLKITAPVRIPFACRSKYSTCKLILRRYQRITNLAYRLKSHHTRNLYLRARLDTCADVYIMPASMYRLVFKDPEMKKLATSS